MPVEAAPQRQQEHGIIDRAGGQTDQRAGNERASVGGHGPHDQCPWKHMIHPARHDCGVGKEQVEHGRRDPQPHGVEMPPADEDHAHDDCQLREDRHDPRRGFVDDATVSLAGFAGVGGVGVGREQPLGRDLRQHEEQRIAGAQPG